MARDNKKDAERIASVLHNHRVRNQVKILDKQDDIHAYRGKWVMVLVAHNYMFYRDKSFSTRRGAILDYMEDKRKDPSNIRIDKDMVIDSKHILWTISMPLKQVEEANKPWLTRKI